MKIPNNLSIEIATELPHLNSSASIVVCVFNDEPHVCGAINTDVLRRTCENIVHDGEFKGEEGTSLFIHTDARYNNVCCLLLVGLGAHTDFSPAALRRAAGMAVRQARNARIKHLYFILPESS